MNVADTTKARLDIVSVILSTIGFGCVLFGFSSAGSKGWDHPIVITTIITGILVTTLFCLRQIKCNDPLLNLSVFKYKIFTLTSVINVLITMIMYADLILLPIYLQNGSGFTAFESGLLLLSGAVINTFLSPITGKMYDKYGAKPLFITGLIFIIISMWGVIDLTESTTYMYVMVRTIILRIGLSIISMPLNTAGLNALPRELGSHAAELSLEKGNITAIQLAKLSSIFGSSDAYLFMLFLSFVALIFGCFMPKKVATQQLESKASN
ncbi:Drug:H+ antiporter-2 (14 Spanner) (DHA2) family drug resistance MFS transporter [Bacillus cereus]|nr:Drug:H+ antiporter-2 (14 Spanner) (DHA2) family drug resistance MFS transporter [Bacillus cereus]